MNGSFQPAADDTALRHALALLAERPLIDGHNDLPWALRRLGDRDLTRYDLRVRQTVTHTDLPRLAQGRIGGQFWSVYSPSGGPESEAVQRTLEQIDMVRRLVARYPDHLELADTAADVEAAFARGRVASLIGAEGGHVIGGSLEVLRALRALGVRYLTLTHNDNTAWADSATDAEQLGGLSSFGREVVREMNRIGVIVDLSHVSAATMRDALAATSTPVIFSHSSARALCDHVRNVPDDVLGRLSSNGGVCMVTFVAEFVSERLRAWEHERADLIAGGGDLDSAEAALGPRPAATLADVADHIEHVRAVAGVEHVGIGGDFDGCRSLPEGMEDVSRYPALVAELVGRGWSDADIVALTGGNVLRVLQAAQDAEDGTVVARRAN